MEINLSSITFVDMSETIDIFSLSKLDSVIRLCNELNEKKDCDELIIDFSYVRYVRPAATAVFAREIRSIVKYRKEKELKTKVQGLNDSNRVVSYLNFIGFFKFIGVKNYGEEVRTTVIRNGRYIPITKFCYTRFKPDPDSREIIQPADLIDIQASEISRLFTTDSMPHVSLKYVICEILRNAYEHSLSDNFFVFGQYWRTGEMELVILDDGVGIHQTLLKKYPYLTSQYDAIMKSLEPGVSRASFEPELNEYGNSGFGLYVVSELAKKHGAILVASNDATIAMNKDRKLVFQTTARGTLVCVKINNIWDVDYDKEIDSIIAAGQKISLQGEYPVSPSKRTLSYK